LQLPAFPSLVRHATIDAAQPASETATGRRVHKLYSMQRSGNCYKVRLALAQLAIPYENVEIDILKGETHTPDFLAKNPNGQIPLLEIAPGRHLAESNAILWFLADGSPLGGGDPAQRATLLQWLFFEQHAIVPNIGAAYFWLCLVRGGRELQRHALDDWMEEGQRALALLDKHLGAHRYVAGNSYSIADIALYAYTHLAEQCDFDLTPFPALRAWLARVAAEPGHVGMDWNAASLSAAE
jgi:glutathione S-transferase